MNADISLDSLWGRRLAGIDLELDAFRPVKREDVVYIQDNCYPFAQLVNTTGTFPEEVLIEFFTARSGWRIIFYGDAMCTSFNYQTRQEIETAKILEENERAASDENGADSTRILSLGTVINQSFITAEAMIDIAIQHDWGGIEIVSGSPFMKWALWAAAQLKNVFLDGFIPTTEDEARLKRIQKTKSSTLEITPQLQR